MINFLSVPTGATDEKLKEILDEFGDLANLETLDLWCCVQVTDAGLENLKGLTNLKTLDLRGCDKITDAGVERLQKALPNCKIHCPERELR